jgi:hypothetical protein
MLIAIDVIERSASCYYARDNQTQVGDDFFGVGGAMTSADNAALKEAQDAAKGLPAPPNWSGPQNGYSW